MFPVYKTAATVVDFCFLQLLIVHSAIYASADLTESFFSVKQLRYHHRLLRQWQQIKHKSIKALKRKEDTKH